MALDKLIEHWSVKPGLILTELGRTYSLEQDHNDSYEGLLNSESIELKKVVSKAIKEGKTSLKDDITINAINALQEKDVIRLHTNLIGYADYTVSSYIHGRVIGTHSNNNIAPLAMVVTVYEQETGNMPVELAKINTTEGAGRTSVIGGAISPNVGINPQETVYNRLKSKLGIIKDSVISLNLTGASIDRTDNYLELSYLAYVKQGAINLPEERKKSVSLVTPDGMIKLLDRRIDCWKASVFYSVACSLSHFFEVGRIQEIIEKQERELKKQPFAHTFSIESRRQNGEPL